MSVEAKLTVPAKLGTAFPSESTAVTETLNGAPGVTCAGAETAKDDTLPGTTSIGLEVMMKAEVVSAAVIGENPRLFGFDFDNPLLDAGRR